MFQIQKIRSSLCKRLSKHENKRHCSTRTNAAISEEDKDRSLQIFAGEICNSLTKVASGEMIQQLNQ